MPQLSAPESWKVKVLNVKLMKSHPLSLSVWWQLAYKLFLQVQLQHLDVICNMQKEFFFLMKKIIGYWKKSNSLPLSRLHHCSVLRNPDV